MQELEVLTNDSSYPKLVGKSQAISQIESLIRHVASTDAKVIITGESGSGKEVVARQVHALSQRSKKPFVPINCGAIPEELLESELFGHEKGAFTGAVSARMGRFEMAEGGTLFLDEIGDMPLHMQVKLLRVLQESVYERVGGDKTITADVRIIAATHRDLESLVASGKFRQDLFFRLSVFPIELEPLRDLAGDIPLLIEEVFKRHIKPESVFTLSDQAMHCLMRYHWPGNVRELTNLVERLSILCAGREVELSDLPQRYRDVFISELKDGIKAKPVVSLRECHIGDDGIGLKEQLQEIEVSLIREALNETNWVVARSAKKLNVQRTTLVEKMRKYEILR